jgi:transposase
MKTRALSDAEKGLVVGMHTAGMRGAHIAQELEMPPSTVYTVLQNFRLRGTVVSPKSPGRPRKLTNRNMRHLERVLHDDRRIPLMEITNQMADIAKVSCRTVRNALNDLGYRNRVAAKKPFLIKKHKVDRLAFAKQHRNWTEEDWKNIIWTDESCFEVGKNSRQIRVWRKPYERYESKCLAPIFKSGRTSVLIWGAFSGFDKCPLVIMPPHRRSASDFVDIVYEGTLSGFYFLHDHPEDLTLMEDGAPVHRSMLPNLWRQAHGIKKLKWPANSPDLNPIENLWKILKDGVQNTSRPRNKEELVESLNAVWEELPFEILQTLIASMPTRMKEVIDAKGGSTRF